MKANAIKLVPIVICVITIMTTLSFVSVKSTATKKTNAEVYVKPKVAFENVEFDFDKAAIRAAHQAELEKLAALVLANNYAVKLSGHADSIGEYVYNWKLSKSRADEIKIYLIEKGVDSSKVAATEFGNTKPLASNTTSEGRQRNRRVEIELVE